MKIYISRPINGCHVCNIQISVSRMKRYIKMRHANALILNSDAYDLIDTKYEGEVEESWGVKLSDVLAECIKTMALADVVYFHANWEQSKGCRLEKTICDLYGIPYAIVPEEWC